MYPHIHVFDLFKLETYWLFISLASICSTLYFFHRTKGMRNLSMTLASMVLVAAVVGGRLYHVLYEAPWFYMEQPFRIFYLLDGGMGFYGSVIGIIISLILFCFWKKEPFLFWADRLALPISLGYLIGRWGCFFHGCCYGGFCSLPWGVEFDFSPYPRHPTQLYSSVSETFLLGGLIFLEKKISREGVLFFSWLLGHAVIRILIEPLRDDYRGEVIRWGLTGPSFISFILIILSLAALFDILRIQED